MRRRSSLTPLALAGLFTLVFNLVAVGAQALTFAVQGTLSDVALSYRSGNFMGTGEGSNVVLVGIPDFSVTATVNTDTFEIHIDSFSSAPGEVAPGLHLDGLVDLSSEPISGFTPIVTETFPEGCGITIFDPPCRTRTTGGQRVVLGAVSGWTTSTDFYSISGLDPTGITLSINPTTGLSSSVPIVETLGIASALTETIYTDATTGTSSAVDFSHPDISSLETLLSLRFQCGFRDGAPFCDTVWVKEELRVVNAVSPIGSDYVPFADYPGGANELTGVAFRVSPNAFYRPYSSLKVIPEPSTELLLGLGLAGLAAVGSRRSTMS